MQILKKMAAHLPERGQAELKRLHFARQIKADRFRTPEAEFDLLAQWIAAGDWVIDIGANVGHYTKRMSELVGASGRVLSFEPVPATFALLAANAELFRFANVSLFNAAASDRMAVVSMTMPDFDSGLHNFYEAHLTEQPEDRPADPPSNNALSVLTLPVDSVCFGQPISFIKIDAEGHEAAVLAGMDALIERCKPTLLVETGSSEVVERLASRGYDWSRGKGSANVVFSATRPLGGL